MRGAQGDAQRSGGHDGIIPADAGSTGFNRLPKAYKEDHPRGCGEHLTSRSVDLTSMGSSPRMRGAQANRQVPHIRFRIIPADAGST